MGGGLSLRVVADRLPLTLMVSLGSVKASSAVLEEFSFRYHLRQERRRAAYRPIGFVKYIAAKAYFVVYWRRAGDVLLYDGSKIFGRVLSVGSETNFDLGRVPKAQGRRPVCDCYLPQSERLSRGQDTDRNHRRVTDCNKHVTNIVLTQTDKLLIFFLILAACLMNNQRPDNTCSSIVNSMLDIPHII